MNQLPTDSQDDRPTFFRCRFLHFLSEFFGHFLPVRWDNSRQVKKGARSAVFQPNWIQLSMCVAEFISEGPSEWGAPTMSCLRAVSRPNVTIGRIPGEVLFSLYKRVV